jgi:hypothetical protein
MGDMDYAKGVDTGRYQGAVNISNAAALISQKRTREFTVAITADGAASTNLSEFTIHAYPKFSGGAKVTDIRVTPVANVTTNATNFAIIKVQSRDDAGGNALTVGIVNTAVGNMVAFVTNQATFTNNQLTLASLGKLTLRHDKSGAGGIQLPAYSVTVAVEDT